MFVSHIKPQQSSLIVVVVSGLHGSHFLQLSFILVWLLCLPFARTQSAPLCCFCRRRCLSWVPSRHVAVATGVKGADEISKCHRFPPPANSHCPNTYLCSSTASLPSIFATICHPFVAFRSGGKHCIYGASIPHSFINRLSRSSCCVCRPHSCQ